MPVRSSRAMIPLDILDKIADDPEGFKACLKEFSDAQEASRKEAEKAASLSQAVEAAMEEFAVSERSLAEDRSAFDRDCEKRRRALEKLEKRSAGRATDLDVREGSLDGRADAQDLREIALDERETGLDTRETVLNAKEDELNALNSTLNEEKALLATEREKLQEDIRDLNARLEGFRVAS